MIKLVRLRTAEAIAKKFVGTERVNLNTKLLQDQIEILKGNAEKHEWDSGIWGKTKPQLLKETANKCAYCEAPLKAVAYGDVEHYRPKSVYWWLAYNYENYLASCTLCNQAFKKDHFPILKEVDIQKGPAITATTSSTKLNSLAAKINCDPLNDNEGLSYAKFIAAHKKEKALLINPYYEDPETIFEYIADDNLQQVDIQVKPSTKNAKAINDAIVANYGLNRVELSQLRYEWYDNYITFKLTLQEPNISTTLKNRIKAKIEKLKQNTSPFCGMVRFFDK